MPDLERGARSKAIRDYLKTKPKAGPNEIVTALGAQGIEVTKGLVSNIKYGGKKKKAARQGPRASATGRRGRRAGISASQAIRDYMRRHPAAKPAEIKAGLRRAGVNVRRGLISNIKFNLKKAGAPSLRVAARKKTKARRSMMTVEHLVAVKRLSDELGGAAQLRRALETLESFR